MLTGQMLLQRTKLRGFFAAMCICVLPCNAAHSAVILVQSVLGARQLPETLSRHSSCLVSDHMSPAIDNAEC